MSWTTHDKDKLEATIADRLKELATVDSAYGELVVSEVKRLPEVGPRAANWDVEISGGTPEYREIFRQDLDRFRSGKELW